MPRVLARHDALLRAVVVANNGIVFRTVGDAVNAAFPDAHAALNAALAGQRAILGEPWEDSIDLRVRMAIHSGPAEVRDGDYVGHTLNRVARLLSAGHGGQILLSAVAQELACEHVPAGVELRDLGEHRLKDLVRPERIYQVEAPDLPRAFPPLVTAGDHAASLPATSTSFVGREREIGAVIELLDRDDTRLLTLTGPGGTGKSRLALQVGAALLDRFADGVYFVPLSPVADPSLVPTAVAEVLGVQEVAGQRLEETIASQLRNRTTLLILDNFEHVLEAAPLAQELLAASPALKIMATSRAVLHVSGEHEYAVPPLQVPDPRRVPELSQLSQYDAVALFIRRAQAVKPDFEITNDNAPAVAEICHRLDGLPLAIELAAARIRLFPPQALLRRLERSLPFLTGGAKDLPARQQTLRGALDWGYNLLTEEEQRFFRRLAVFSGGWDFGAAEAVCNPEGDLDTIGGIESLLEKSFILGAGGDEDEPRFTMLQVIREYGMEKLAESGEAELMQQRHATFFVQMAEEAQMGLQGPDQTRWLQRLKRENDNIRAALVRALENSDSETAVRLGAAMALIFWYGTGDWREGREWLERALALPEAEGQRHVRARALAGLGQMCYLLNDFPAARMYLDQAIALAGEVGDWWAELWAIFGLSWATAWEGDLAAGRELAERVLAQAREHNEPWLIANTIHGVGAFAALQKDYEIGQAYLEDSVEMFRSLHDEWALAYTVNTLGDLYRLQGNYRRAASYYAEALQLFDNLGIRAGRASVLHNLGYVALHEGDATGAARGFQEALSLFQDVQDRRGMAECVIGLGAVAEQQGSLSRAAHLFAAGQRALKEVGSVLTPSNEVDYAHHLSELRNRLAADDFQAAWEAGERMTLDAAIASARNIGSQPVEAQ
jgi:predicted ATPase